MKISRNNSQAGFSMVELIISMVLTLIVLGGAVSVYVAALNTRERESGRVDAISSAQAALNVMSREIGNGGYGLSNDNGLVVDDSDGKNIRVRANITNTDGTVSSPGEDILYMYDSASKSVVRYDRFGPSIEDTTGIINRISDVDFLYHKYDMVQADCAETWIAAESVCVGPKATANTSKVTIKLKVLLPDVPNEPPDRIEQVTSDVTLRNAPYVLSRY